MAGRIPVVIDTDPGIDDAAALAVALFSPALDVRLITTVAGNVSIEKTTRNALRLESFLGTHVPVSRGASRPLAGIGIEAGAIHGESGLGDWDYGEAADELLLDAGAVEALWDAADDDSATGGPDLGRRIWPTVARIDTDGVRFVEDDAVAAVVDAIVASRSGNPGGAR